MLISSMFSCSKRSGKTNSCHEEMSWEQKTLDMDTTTGYSISWGQWVINIPYLRSTTSHTPKIFFMTYLTLDTWNMHLRSSFVQSCANPLVFLDDHTTPKELTTQPRKSKIKRSYMGPLYYLSTLRLLKWQRLGYKTLPFSPCVHPWCSRLLQWQERLWNLAPTSTS